MKLVTVEQMKAIEAASDAAGHTYDAMMDRAGVAVAQVVQQYSGAGKGKRILVLVGSGNNGGDGLVAARHLREAGAEVACYLLKPRDDARVTVAREAGAFIGVLPDDRGLRVLRRFSLGADVVVDALFGTGARLPLPPDAHKLLNTVKGDIEARRNKDATLTAPASPAARFDYAQDKPAGPLIVAVDGPSGMDFDSGALDVSALPADVSVTFAYPKIGHTRFPAADACGELIVADIGVDPGLASGVTLELADPHMIRRLLPVRPASAHKGTFGKVMIVAGSIHYSGAPALAAAAAYRCGAGLVTVAAPRSVLPIVASRLAEATFQPLPDSMGIVSADALPILSKALEGYRAILIGPGLTHEKEAAAFLTRLLGGEPPSDTDSVTDTRMTKMESDSAATLLASRPAGSTRVALPPLVFDADGLNVVSEKEEWWKLLPESSVLTPHPGEMARLTRLERDEIEADRIGVASRFSQTWGHVVVLKGAFTVVTAPDGRIVLMPFANPALATAGSGDVLAGAIASLRAQGLDAFDAALCGAYLHGLSGRKARTEIGRAGVVAGDLLERLPAALRQLTGV